MDMVNQGFQHRFARLKGPRPMGNDLPLLPPVDPDSPGSEGADNA
jgi:hypothetical protein